MMKTHLGARGFSPMPTQGAKRLRPRYERPTIRSVAAR